MVALTGKPAARGAPAAAEERGDNPRSPDELEAEALAELRGIERAMQARAEAAFPDRNDPLRLYGEGMAAAGVAHGRATSKLTAAMFARVEGVLAGARRTAEAQMQAATAKAEADRAAAKLEAVEAVRAGLGEVIASDRRSRIGWSVGIAGLGVALVFGAGLLTGHWWARSSGVADAADKLAELRAEAVKATVALAAEQARLRQAADGMQRAVSDAGAGLSVLRTIGNLPEPERAAMHSILDALAGAAGGTRPNPQLQAVRELMALPSATRAQAIEFAKIGEAQFRAAFLPVVRIAEARSRAPWWAGEAVYPGCVTNGPALATQSGGSIPTCVMQLPDAWQATDIYLRTRHYGLPAR